MGIFSVSVLGMQLLACVSSAGAWERTSGTSHVIQASDIPEELEDHEAALADEFCGISTRQRSSWCISTQLENLFKNRYKFILPYDDTRVVLDKLPNDEHSDYINANYINGPFREKEYVATQAPVNNTFNDFWRMMWQLNSEKILTLTNLEENGMRKMDRYWPDQSEKSKQYGDVEVSFVSECSFPDYTIRNFTLSKDSQSRKVTQFHITSWLDHMTPTNPSALVRLLDEAREQYSGPLVVHCSAGVGRTGTAIMIDAMLQRARRNGTVDFPEMLEHMRNQRFAVIENPEQYLFAYRTVADSIAQSGSRTALQSGYELHEEDEVHRSRNLFAQTYRIGAEEERRKCSSLGPISIPDCSC